MAAVVLSKRCLCVGVRVGNMKDQCNIEGCHGYHYIVPTPIGFVECCTDCDHRSLHHNRRKEVKSIDFEDRRKNASIDPVS